MGKSGEAAWFWQAFAYGLWNRWDETMISVTDEPRLLRFFDVRVVMCLLHLRHRKPRLRPDEKEFAPGRAKITRAMVLLGGRAPQDAELSARPT